MRRELFCFQYEKTATCGAWRLRRNETGKTDLTPARRVENVEEYYFSVKLKEVARMNESGTRVINLGIGSPDLPPSAETVQVLCQAAARPDTHGYQPYVGTVAK